MVSTTLTTLAAGQSSMTTNANLHNQSQQQQQRTQSTLTTAAAAGTAKNSNYQRSASSITTTTSTTTTSSTENTTTVVQRQSNNNNNNNNNSYHNNYNSLSLNGNSNKNINNNNNNNIYVENYNNSNSDNVEFNHNTLEQQSQLKEELNYQNYNTFNGSRRRSSGKNNNNNNGANETPTQLTTTTSTSSSIINETTKYVTSNQYDNTKATTATAASGLVNLSESLGSTSPPLNDQISILFPKCRPKQQQQQQQQQNQQHTKTNILVDENNSHHMKNGNDGEETTVTDVNFLMLNEEDNADIDDKQFSLNVTAKINNNNKSNNKNIITTPRTTTNYYKNINIITQSPPPPSTSSISSESLSSVTPRISTNPFLCSSNIEEEFISQQQQQRYLRHLLPTNELLVEEEEAVELMKNQEQLPVPNYNSFYYHTTKGDNSITGDNSDMPRKRVDYNLGFQHHHHHNNNNQQQGQKSQNLKANEDIPHSNSPSNPFLKNSSSYWDRETSSAIPNVSTSNGQATTAVSMEENETELDENRLTHLGPSMSRRTYQQHPTHGGSCDDVGAGSSIRMSQLPPTTHHRGRLAPSPVQRYNDHVQQQQQQHSYAQRKYDTLPALKRMYQQHYQSTNKMSTSHSHGDTAVNNNARYIYGSGNKSSAMDPYGNSSPIDYWEKREKALSRGDYERERERKTFGDRQRDIDRERDRDRDRDRERERDRMREYDWERVREPTRVRDFEHDGMRNWEQERDFERRREHDRERERGRNELLRDQVDEHVARDNSEFGQQQLKQHKIPKYQKQTNYTSMMGNGEIVVFDDSNESWQSKYIDIQINYTFWNPYGFKSIKFKLMTSLHILYT